MTPAMISTVEEFFLTAAAADYPSIGVYPSGVDVPDGVSTYMRIWVIPSEETFPSGIGPSAKSRNVGIIQVDVYGVRGKGAGETGDIANYVAKKFHRKVMEVPSEGWITFKDSSTKDMRDSDEEHRYISRTPFTYDFTL